MTEHEENTTIESPHSVKISINAKGQYAGEVKTYATTPEQAMAQTLQLAAKMEELIREKNKEGR